MKKWLLLTLALASLVVPTLTKQEPGKVDENGSSLITVAKKDKDKEVRDGTETEGIVFLSVEFK